MNIPYINPTADASEIMHHLGCPKNVGFIPVSKPFGNGPCEDVFPIEKWGYSSNRYVSLPIGYTGIPYIDPMGWFEMSRPPSMASVDSSHHSSPGNVSSYRRGLLLVKVATGSPLAQRMEKGPLKRGCLRYDYRAHDGSIYGLGGGFKHFLFLLLPGEIIQFD